METRSDKSASERAVFTRRNVVVLIGIVVLIAAAVVRSSIATSLDGFTFDEAYHIGAGVSYVKTGDFRLNPEHPPLTKLWVGAYLSFFNYEMTQFRPLADKIDERAFVEEDVYNNNDSELIQSRARTAMFALNALLMAAFAAAVWRVLGPLMAVGVTAFLAIDPTVAAHLPVVMTDLPVALLAGTSVLLSVHAFRTWKPLDLVLASAALGLTLSAKHSAVIVVIAVAVLGSAIVALALYRSKGSVSEFLRKTASVAAVLLGAVIVLWAFYFFRYHESPSTHEDQFNRPLAEKINDVRSPVYRSGLNAMQNGYLFPRSFTWGMADTIRAGAEGRVGSFLVFGELYHNKAPWFYFPGVIAVKLPLGLLILSVVGAVLLLVQPSTRGALPYAGALLLTTLMFLFFLIRGSSYGGIRHLMPMFPLFAILAALAFKWAVEKRSYITVAGVGALLLLAAASAVPVMRPWEYFNELIGGTANGHRYFNDEGVDLGQRYKEAALYYHTELVPRGVMPYLSYYLPEFNDPAKTVDYISISKQRDEEKWDGPYATGTFILGSLEISPSPWWDNAAFREAEPITRFGNLFVFRGTFDIRPMRAESLTQRAGLHIYAPEPNVDRAIEMLSEAESIDPRAFFVSIGLGNLHLGRQDRDAALKHYQIALDNMPAKDEIYDLVARQIELLNTVPVENVRPIRNPALE